MGRKVRDRATFRLYVELLHPAPVAAVLVAATAFTAAAARGSPPLDRLGAFLVALLLTQLAISLHNDYCDRFLDARAKPWRVIPSGLLRPVAALALAGVLLGLGLLAASALGPLVMLLVALGTACGLAYNARLKRTAWSWFPFAVALPTLALCAAAVADRFPPGAGAAYVIGIPLAIGIHIADTLPDVPSDTSAGVRGLSHTLGPHNARLLCWVAIAAGQVVALVLWPYGPGPGVLSVAAVGLLLGAVVVGQRSVGRAHWVLVIAASIAIAWDWLSAALA